MSKGRFEVEKLDKGFKICVYEEKEVSAADEAKGMYPSMMERYEGAASSPEEVKSLFDKWMSGAKFESKLTASAGGESKPAESMMYNS